MRFVTHRVTARLLPAYENLDPSEYITNGFTIGKTYDATLNHNGRLLVCLNDNGHERYLFKDESPCAHIVERGGRGRCVGYFQVEATGWATHAGMA